MRQYCVSCDREVCKLKDGQEFKTRCEHFTPEGVNEYTSIESPAMCGDCVRAKKKGYKRFLKGKHFDATGQLLYSDKQLKLKYQLDIKQLEKDQADIQTQLNKKREQLKNLKVAS